MLLLLSVISTHGPVGVLLYGVQARPCQSAASLANIPWSVRLQLTVRDTAVCATARCGAPCMSHGTARSPPCAAVSCTSTLLL